MKGEKRLEGGWRGKAVCGMRVWFWQQEGCCCAWRVVTRQKGWYLKLSRRVVEREAKESCLNEIVNVRGDIYR